VSSTFGAPGQFQLEDLETDPTSGLGNVPETQVDVAIQQGCAVRSGSLAFYDLGRGGQPRTPESLLTTDVVLEEWLPLNSQAASFNSMPGSLSAEDFTFTPIMLIPVCHNHRLSR
jgi:large exoprotein involved in heme utilization and adhesion